MHVIQHIFSCSNLNWNLSSFKYLGRKLWDCIKGLILRRLNAYCGTAAIHEPPQCTRRNVVHLVHCSSCIEAAAMHEAQCTICGCRSLPGRVDFCLSQCRNISPFIPPRKLLGLSDEVLFTRLLQFTR